MAGCGLWRAGWALWALALLRVPFFTFQTEMRSTQCLGRGLLPLGGLLAETTPRQGVCPLLSPGPRPCAGGPVSLECVCVCARVYMCDVCV